MSTRGDECHDMPIRVIASRPKRLQGDTGYLALSCSYHASAGNVDISLFLSSHPACSSIAKFKVYCRY